MPLKIRTALFVPIHLINFVMSSFGKVWESSKTVKSPIVWDFPDIQKLGFIFTVRLLGVKLLGKETCLFQGDNPHVQALLISNLRSGSIFVSLCKQHSKRECMRTAKIGPHLRLLIREVYLYLTLVCVASVCMQFRSKERELRAN